MKKLLFSFFCLIAISASAQDSTLKEYVGRYLFPEGSIVPSAEVTLSNNVLSVNSTQGSSVMQKVARDTFAILSFDGMAYYRRNDKGVVIGVRVEVADHILEGVKENATTLYNRNKYFVVPRQQVTR